jgi:hypothetical protein
MLSMLTQFRVLIEQSAYYQKFLQSRGNQQEKRKNQAHYFYSHLWLV